MQKFQWLLNPRQVILIQLTVYNVYPVFRCLTSARAGLSRP